jgi:anti-anti-sigma regulatory factor
MLQDDHRIIWALNGAGATTDLDWVQSSHMHWGVVGLIEEPSPGQLTHDMALRIVGSSVELSPAAGLEKPLRGRVIPARAFPPLDTIFRLTATHPGEIIKLVPIDSPKRRWGYFACAETHVVSGYESILMRLAVLAGSLEREELVASLQERQQTLSTAYDRERALADTVRELGCPIIPLIKGVLLVPLVGAIDSARSREIIERVLSGVNEQRAVHVLLDITGVPLVDTLVAAALVQTARAAELLGAQVALVGVRPEIAQSIIGLGVDLKAIETYPTLASAVAKLLRRG